MSLLGGSTDIHLGISKRSDAYARSLLGGNFSSHMEAKDGSIGFDFGGTYTKVLQHKLIEASFGDRTLLVEFEAAPEGVTVRETFDAESTHSFEQQRDCWQAILNNFARHVESMRRAS